MFLLLTKTSYLLMANPLTLLILSDFYMPCESYGKSLSKVQFLFFMTGKIFISGVFTEHDVMIL